MNKKALVVGIGSIAVMAGLAGCGTHTNPQQLDDSTAPSTTTTPVPTKTQAQPAQKTLPTGMENHLTNYAQRVIHNAKLPNISVTDSQGKTTSIKAENVVYIAPFTQYAITQLQQSWNKLSTKPAVVWILSTPQSAQQAWTKEGYSSDPLPSPETYYTSKMVPVPDAYHIQGNNISELPGVLKTNEAGDWTNFFNGK